jgi:hypothetical protein
MKKTAVYWLKDCLSIHFSFEQQMKFEGLFQQANEMFEQQIIDACNQTEFEDIDGMGIHETITKGEEYYNETFNK